MREFKAPAIHFGLLAELEQLILVEHNWKLFSSRQGYSIRIYKGEECIAACGECSELHYAVGITRTSYKRYLKREGLYEPKPRPD